ncbi:hypothetical protein SAMN05444358_10945 [Ruegeria halocynthiae]|uniref:Uncharacterized protein n=1 Tax=Ruegeria halocynthiae TaxID=985054 RepID=A0A1H3DQX9_9RHOB|nr:hypothetical protein SAMN05444358_10945 [Ruegeria halocynthiae]
MNHTAGFDVAKDVLILLLKLLAMCGCLVAAMLVIFFVSHRFLGEYKFLFLLVNLAVGLGSFCALLYSMGMLKEEMQKIEKKHRPWLFDQLGNRK